MSTLADILAAEADVVSAFVLLLREEQDVLRNGSPDALPSIVERKTAAALELSPLTAARSAGFVRAGAAAGNAGIEAWLAGRPEDDALRQGWQRLQALAEEARELNRVNGQLIQMRMQANAHALEALLSAANRQDLYGADGQAAPGVTRRIIDSA